MSTFVTYSGDNRSSHVLHVSAPTRVPDPEGSNAMTSYVYIRTEPRLWTAGFYRPDGTWEPDSDHGSQEEAARRVITLNGGTPGPVYCKCCADNECECEGRKTGPATRFGEIIVTMEGNE